MVPMDQKKNQGNPQFAGTLAAGEAINRRNGTNRTKTSSNEKGQGKPQWRSGYIRIADKEEMGKPTLLLRIYQFLDRPH